MPAHMRSVPCAPAGSRPIEGCREFTGRLRVFSTAPEPSETNADGHLGPAYPVSGGVPAIPCAILSATAMMVRVGLEPADVGKTLPSQAEGLSPSWTWPGFLPGRSPLGTEVPGSFPIR